MVSDDYNLQLITRPNRIDNNYCELCNLIWKEIPQKSFFVTAIYYICYGIE